MWFSRWSASSRAGAAVGSRGAEAPGAGASGERGLSSMLYGEYKYISIVTGLAILYTHKHGELSGVYVNPIYIYISAFILQSPSITQFITS